MVAKILANSVNLADGVTITVADNSDTLTLKSTDDDTAEGPVLKLTRDPSGVADGDLLGAIKFVGDDAGGNATDYFELQSSIGDEGAGSEDGRLTAYCMVAGTARNVLDITSGNIVFNQDSQDIDFRVESNGNTHMIFVDAGNDRVGIGLSDPAHALQVDDASQDYVVKLRNKQGFGGHPYGMFVKYTSATPDSNEHHPFIFQDSGTTRFQINSSGDVLNHDGDYGTISDERIKQDIRDANSQWDDIKNIKIRNFKKKDDVRQYGDDAWEQIGVIAQELEAVSPKLIRKVPPSTGDIISDSTFGTLYTSDDVETQGDNPTAKVGEIKEIKEEVKAVGSSIIYMKAVKALQEAMTKIETLETKVKALEDA